MILVGVVAVVGAGVGIWKFQERRAEAAKIESATLRTLTTDDVVAILKNQELVEPSKTYAVVQTAESRAAFLKGLREYMALAAKARKEGIDKDPDVKRILAYREDVLLGSLYQNKLDNEKGDYYNIPHDQIDVFMQDAANAAAYEADLAAMRSIQQKVVKDTGNPLSAPSTRIEGDERNKARDGWARSKMLSAMARQDTAFMSEPSVALRMKVAETGVLATNYLNKYWADKIRVTDEDVAAYLKAHPEYDTKNKLDLAQKILARVKNGEDIGTLAKEFSEDRMSKGKGGLYEDSKPGFLWPEIQQAAMALENGRVADRLIETKDGYHILQLVNKRTEKEGDREVPVVTIKHILLQKRFEEPGVRVPNVPPPFLTPREIAEAAVIKEKRQAFVDQIIAAEPVSLPEDFPYEVTEELKNSGVRIENMMEQIEAEEKEARKQLKQK